MREALRYFQSRFFRQSPYKAALGFFVASLMLGFVFFVMAMQAEAGDRGRWFIKELPPEPSPVEHLHEGHSPVKQPLAKPAPIEPVPEWALPLESFFGEVPRPEALPPGSDGTLWDIGAQNWPANETRDGNGPVRLKGESVNEAVTPEKKGKAGAKAAESEVVELDIYDVWRMALKHNEVIGIAGEDLRLSELEIDRAYAAFLPKIDANASYKRFTREEKAGAITLQPRTAKRYEVGFTQPVYSGGRARSYYRRALHEYRSDQFGYEAIRQRVVMDASVVFYDHLKAHQTYEIRRASLSRVRRQLRVARKRYELGVGIRADLLRGEAEVANKGVELQKALAEYDNTLAHFQRLTGFEGAFTISSDYKASKLDMELEEFIELALKKRRDYLGKKALEDAAEAGIKHAKSNFMPYLDLEGSYIYDDQDPASEIFSSHSGYGMLTFTLPIFEGGLRRAELKQARSRRRKADLERLSARRDIELEVRRAYTNVYSAAAIVRLSEKELDYAAENYRLVFGRFRLGFANSTEVIDAEATLIEAEIGIYTARDGYEMAVLELKRSSGILLDEVNARVK